MKKGSRSSGKAILYLPAAVAAFNKLLEQREAEEESASKLDSSSPSAGLVNGNDVLQEAREEIRTPRAKKEEEDDIADLLATEEETTDQEAKSQTSAPKVPKQEAAKEPIEEPSEEEERAKPKKAKRSKSSPASRRARRPAPALTRAKLIPQKTLVSSLSAFISFLGLSTIFGAITLSIHSPDLVSALYLLPSPIIALALAYLIKRIGKLETMPLPSLNLFFLILAVISIFGLGGQSLLDWKIFSLRAKEFRPFLLSLVVISGLHYIFSSRLLHRSFRYFLATMGIYSLTALIQGIASRQSYDTIIAQRQLELTGDASGAISSSSDLLLRAFEPTFIAVNCFIPILVIVLSFEAMRLLRHRLWKHAGHLLLATIFFALTLFANTQIYERAGVPNLKSLVKGEALEQDIESRSQEDGLSSIQPSP